MQKVNYCLLKLCALLYYSKSLNYFIFDLKFENIKFDDLFNTILIDFSEDLFKKYIKDQQYIIWKKLIFSFWYSCYIKKKSYYLLKL